MVKKRLLLRGLWKRQRVLCLCMALLCALGAGFFSGSYGFYHSLTTGYLDYLDEYGYADAVISVKAAYRADGETLAALEGVEGVESRLYLNTAVTANGGESLAVRAFSYEADTSAPLYFWEGEWTARGVCLEYNFAADNGISVGDTLSMRFGADTLDLTVSGIVSAPETLGSRTTDTWGASPDLGMLYFDASLLSSSQFASLCNRFLLTLSPDADADAVLAAACDTLSAKGVTVTEGYTRRDSPVLAVYDDNAEPLRPLCHLLPAFFLLLVLCVLTLSAAILVRQCRREIGTLRSLGCDIREIRALFSALLLRCALAGAALSLPIAYAVNLTCTRFYRDFFPLPSLPCRMDWAAFALSLALTLGLSQLAACLGCRAVAAISPAEAQRDARSDAVRQPLPVRTVLRRASPLVKFSMTTLLRSPRRFAFTALCTAATVTIVFSALSFRAANEYILTQLFSERIHYDTLAYLHSAASEEELAAVRSASGVTAVERAAYYTRDLSAGEKTLSVTLLAIESDSALVSVPDVPALPETGIVLEQYAADFLGVTVGDSVCIDGVTLPVTAVSSQTTARVQHLSLTQAAALGASDYDALLCAGEDSAALSAALETLSGFLCAVQTGEMSASAHEIFDTFYFVIRIVLIFALSIGLVVVLTATRASLSERRREVCVMRSLGVSRRAVSRSFLLQSALQFCLGCLLGLPLGELVSRFIFTRSVTPRRAYLYASGAEEFLLTAALLAAYLLLGHILSMRVMRSWNLAESTKSCE